MYSNLLYELEKEIQLTDFLLAKASRIAAAQKFEDGSRKPTKKKKRKKRKLTPEQRKKQKKEQKLIKKVKDRLKEKKYKSRQTGDELSFNTAYNRKHPKAVKDFNKAMDKARGSDSKGDSPSVSYSVKAKLNDEQYDLLSRMNNGRDMRDMSLVEERTMRDIMALLMDIHEEINEEEPKKTRKTRSDKGKKRGPRVKKKLEESLEELDLTDDFNSQEASTITEEEVKETKEVLDERAKERQEQTGEEEPEPKTRKTRSDKGKSRGPRKKKPVDENKTVNEKVEEALKKEEPEPVKKEEPIPEAPLLEQPSYVQKEEIKDLLESAFKEALNTNTREIAQLKKELEDDSLSSSMREDLEEKLKELESKDLASTRKDTRTIRRQIDEMDGFLDSLTEDQVKSMVGMYSAQANSIEDQLKERGLKGLREYIDEEMKDLKPPELKPLESLQKDLSKTKDKLDAANVEKEESDTNLETISRITEELKAKEEKGTLTADDLKKAKEELEEIWIGTDSTIGDSGTELNLTDFTSKLESQQEDNKKKKENAKKIEDKVKSLTSDVEDYDKVKEAYADKLGVYLALSNAKKGMLEDVEFGLNDFPSDADLEDQEKHKEQLRRAQTERFRDMDKDQRDNMVNQISDRVNEIKARLDDEDITEEEKNELTGKLRNIIESEAALNTVRMINSEGVIDGYFEVPDNILEIARQTGSEVWDDAITNLSRNGSSPKKTREQIESISDNLSNEDFKSLVGGPQGPYGEMLDLMDDDFCPNSSVNKSKGVGGKKIGPNEECPNPLSDETKKMLRDYMSGSFVNTQTVQKEVNRDAPKSKSKQLPKKIKEEVKFFWKERKDKFFEIFVDGIDQSTGVEYTQEEREAAAEEFRSQWVQSDMNSMINGVQLYDDSAKTYRWEQLMLEMKRIKSLSDTERRQREREIKEKLLKLFDDGATSEPENQSSTNKQGNIFNSFFIYDNYKSGGTKTMLKRSTQYVDYQQRSQSFELGMRVYPFLGGNPSRSGIVIAIFPAIGMVDVQFPHGSQRYPVEDLVVDTSGDYSNVYSEELGTVPGGVGTYPVSSPPFFTHEEKEEGKKASTRVASRYIKKAIYWYKKDRTYRQCRNEEVPCCPKCKDPLGTTVYKRRSGKSEKLLVCRSCLFIIKPSDIVKG